MSPRALRTVAGEVPCENTRVGGSFAVAGTFRLAGRGLIAFGDVVSGDVRVDEGLLIPLNSSTTISARIQSVEVVVRSDRSYVGLLLAEDDLEAGILEALRFDGEELQVSPIPGRTTFAEAVERLRKLLRELLRPDQLVWVPASHVIRFPFHVYILRPRTSPSAESSAKRAFDSAADECIAVRVGALASTETKTFATVWPIYELGDGEAMFVHDSVKTDAPDQNPNVIVVNSRLRWWIIDKLYRRWQKRVTAEPLGTA